ncbi:MAG: Asp-tRNA(Asn)/Glu-tRNA(Gln) amidotransferase subunit GatA [Pseudomonadota bacterium]
MQVESIARQAADLRAGVYSSVELTQHYLTRIRQLDGALNSLITVTEEIALAQAQAADKQLATGSAGPLAGIPIVHKDVFCTQGVRTSCGSRMLDNFVAPYDATMVSRLQAAGCVMLGKANMDEFAMGSSNENSFYGPVHNPWSTDCVPGGSSGGSAVAVAARLCAAATGSDTGGSVRQPAALTGITGLKPTYGRCSRWGMVAFASSLDQAGILAHSAQDAATLLQTMAGFDAQDSTCAQQSVPDYAAGLAGNLRGLRIGLPREFFADGLDAEVAALVQQAAQVYESLGATLVEVNLPASQASIPAYYVVALAEASSNLSRYDGVRFGHRSAKTDDLAALYAHSRAEGFGTEVKRRIMLGTYVLSEGYYDAYYVQAQKVRQLIADDFQRVLQEVDLLLGPVTPFVSFELGKWQQDPVQMYLSDIYTVPVSLAGLPALSHPAGFAQNGMPVGVQLIGNYWAEPQLLQTAHQYQGVTDWHQQAPDLSQVG